jgi:ketosteroid isomerase-like protein
MGAPATPQACMTAFVAALNAKDMDAALALLTEDAAFFYSNGSALWGKAAIREAIAANWASIDRDNYATHNPVWLAQSESAAVAVYGFSWSGLSDGKQIGGRGRGTSALRRESGGWRIAHEHLSQGRWRVG